MAAVTSYRAENLWHKWSHLLSMTNHCEKYILLQCSAWHTVGAYAYGSIKHHADSSRQKDWLAHSE